MDHTWGKSALQRDLGCFGDDDEVGPKEEERTKRGAEGGGGEIRSTDCKPIRNQNSIPNFERAEFLLAEIVRRYQLIDFCLRKQSKHHHLISVKNYES